MTLKEITTREKENNSCIFLYKEGIFWKAYEKSAYAFCVSYQNYKPTRKLIKSIGEEVVSIGFPVAVLTNRVPIDRIKIVSETACCIEHTTQINSKMYQIWKDAAELKVPLTNKTIKKLNAVLDCKESAQSAHQSTETLVEQIKTFPLEDRTPLECLRFVAELKGQVAQ